MGSKEIQETLERRKEEIKREEVRRQNTEKKKEKRFDRIFQVFLAVIPYILGILTEHFCQIMDAVARFLHG